jgi:hypothetical protein
MCGFSIATFGKIAVQRSHAAMEACARLAGDQTQCHRALTRVRTNAALVPQWNTALRSVISPDGDRDENSQECVGGFSMSVDLNSTK